MPYLVRYGNGAYTQMIGGWWSRFARARDFLEAWLQLHQGAALANAALGIRLPDGRRFSFDKGVVRGVAKRPKWVHIKDPQRRLTASMRTTFSSIFRGVESVILDRALQLIYPLRTHGLRLVAPMYDGALLQAPEASAEALTSEVRRAFLLALTEVGVPAGVSCEIRAAWGEGVRR